MQPGKKHIDIAIRVLKITSHREKNSPYFLLSVQIADTARGFLFESNITGLVIERFKPVGIWHHQCHRTGGSINLASGIGSNEP
jgi:hypothetical protein